MLNSNLDSKVLVVGGGPVGLFTALQLCQLQVPVRIIEESSRNEQTPTDILPSDLPTSLPSSTSSYDCPGIILLLSPRALQLLQSINLYDDVVACGVKHWQLQIHTSTPATATTSPISTPSSTTSPTATNPTSIIAESPTLLDTIHSYKLWENKATDLNFCLSIERSRLCHLLEGTLLQRYGIKVDYDCELVDIRRGGGLENIVYMENELDSDFYLGNDQLLANAAMTTTKENTKNAPIMTTIKQQGNQYNQERIQICQTHYVVVASGKSSPVRQHSAGKSLISSNGGIGEGHQHRRIQRQLSVKSTLLNKKTKSGNHYFYSMVAKVKTNFPGLKPVSIVAKSKGTLLILVHGDYASMVIQQSKTTIDDDCEELIPLMKTQTAIQQLLKPYEISFVEIYDYCYWKDPLYHLQPDAPPTRMHTRSIALGGAYHDIQPSGWILPDMGFEQAANLCWKLDLDIRRRCTPQLLSTYYDETRIKKKDAYMASDVLLRLLRDPFAITQGTGGMTKLLQGHRHCFIGGMLLENNQLNMNCPQTQKVQRGWVGTLAPNGRLKPYNLNYLLTQQTNNYHKTPSTTFNDKKLNHQSLASLSSNEGSITHQQDNNSNNGTNKLKFLRGLFTFPSNKKNQQITLSPTGITTPSTPPTATGDKWKGIRANHYQLWDQLSSHTGNMDFYRSTFTILVLCGSLLDSNSLLALRRLKKHLDQPNSFLRMFEYPQHQYSHHHHQQQQKKHPQLSRSKSTPTNLSLSSSNNTNDTMTQLAFRQPQQPRRSESSSSFYSVRSGNSSIDDSISNDSHHQNYGDGNNTNFQSNRSSLFTRLSSSSTDRYSMATTISNNSATSNNAPTLPSIPPLTSPVEIQHDEANLSSTKNHQDNHNTTSSSSSSSSSSMFSFVCLTTSSKSECTQFLSEQTPYSLHQLFPFGLTKTFLDHDQQCHQSYAIKGQQQHRPTLVVIRRDGYVGARIAIEDQPLCELNQYFDQILLPVVDFSSAAALVANDYCL